MRPASHSEFARCLAFLFVAAIFITACQPKSGLTAELDAALAAQVQGRSRHALLAIDAPLIDLTYRGAAGIARADTQDTITPDWQFYTTSVAKAFTAVVIHQLAEEGVFGPQGVDAALASLDVFPPEVIDALHRIDGVSYGDQITLRRLLNHTAGLRDFAFDGIDNPVSLMPGTADGAAPDSLVGVAVFDEKLGLASLVQCKMHGIPQGCNPQDYTFSRQWVMWDYPAWQANPGDKMAGLLNFYLAGMNEHAIFPPGKGFHYSDTGYLILALVIEHAGGRSLHQELRARIFDPLQMDHTYLINDADPPSQTYTHRLADVWAWDEPTFSGGVNYSFERGGGGIVSTLDDLHTFARALAAGRLFQKDDTLNDMLTVPSEVDGIYYASGLIVFPTRQGPVWYMMGSNGSWVEYFPARDLWMVGTTDDFNDMPGQFMFHIQIAQLLANRGLSTPMARMASWPMSLMMLAFGLALLLYLIWLVKGLVDALRNRSPGSLKIARWLVLAAFLANLAMFALIGGSVSNNAFQMLFGFSPQVRNLFTLTALISGVFALAMAALAARAWRRSQGSTFDRALLTGIAALILLCAFSLVMLGL